MKTAPLPSTIIESTVSNCTNTCGHLVLLEYGTSHTGLAFQLAAELLKWPEEVAVKLYYDDSTNLPVIPITNKYFSTRVDITIITDSERINMTNSSTVLEQELLQNSTLMTGCVIIVDGSMRPEDILWNSIPEKCLFRILMLFSKDNTTTRNEMWYDACVNNGFEYVSHSNGYEVVPEGAETCGLLGGDLCGAARLLQVLHNTLWPESCRVVKCHNSNGTKSDNNNNNNNNNSEKETLWKHESMLENKIALISIQPRDVLDWFYDSLKDHRFFTVEWPPNKEKSQYQTMTSNTNTNSNNTMLAIANKYYTSMVGVECIHPALFFPAMEDLFMTQYLNKCPQLAVLCWPPSSTITTTTKSIKRKEHIFTDNCDYPPLSVFIERLQRWGVKEYIVLVTTSVKGVLSPEEEYYCAEKSIEILYINNNEMDTYDTREFGPIGADRLAEIIHTITWPQRYSIPKTTMKSSSSTLSLSSFSVSSGLLKEKKNRILVWAVGTSPAEEELLLQSSLTSCLSISSTPHSINTSTLLSLSIPSMQSNSLSTPLQTVRVVNKYFEANVDVHCYGGARRVVMRESDPNIDQLQSFGIVILVTTSAAIEEVKEKEERLEKTKSIQERLFNALETCCAAENIAHDACSSVSLLAYDEHHGKDITHELSEAAENAPVYMLYILDGDASSDILTTKVDTLLLQAATATATTSTNEETEKEKEKEKIEVKQDILDISHDKEDNIDKSNNSSTSNSSNMDDTFVVSPFEVLYGVDEEDPVVHLRESIEQHVWPYRNMLKDIQTETISSEINKNEEKKEVVEEDLVYIGCDLPPDYLVDPITCKSEYVAALSVRTITTTGTTKSDIVDGQLDDKQQQQEQQHQEDLMVWMDKMKHYGHKLHRTVRQRQAELLANKLGECLGALDGL